MASNAYRSHSTRKSQRVPFGLVLLQILRIMRLRVTGHGCRDESTGGIVFHLRATQRYDDAEQTLAHDISRTAGQ